MTFKLLTPRAARSLHGTRYLLRFNPHRFQLFCRNYASEQKSSPPSSGSSDTDSLRDIDRESLPPGWEDNPDYNITRFSELPHKSFGFNQHMVVNAEFKEALRQVLWQFRAPIRYAFAYGSGVFPQSSSPSADSAAPIHPNPPEAVTKWQKGGQKNIDFIFGVSFTQHWHSINLSQHRNHYSFLGSAGSAVVSRVQDKWGAGALFHPYVVVNGVMVKYGVVNLDTLYEDLTEWRTMYLAGRLQKPVKILRDDARIRLANQVNLISALRTALLMLPADFTEHDLYMKIASISYMGDPRMAFRAESPRKVANIVDHQMTNFRQLYLPLIDDLPNVAFADQALSKSGWLEDSSVNCRMQQDMDPVRRGNMVYRLPKHFREKLYKSYQSKFSINGRDFAELMARDKDETKEVSRSVGGDFDRRIAQADDLQDRLNDVLKSIINWPSLMQAVKGVVTAGVRKGWRYLLEKRAKGKLRKGEAAAKSSKADAAGSKDSATGKKNDVKS